MRKVIIGLSLLFWPLSLFLINTKVDFLTYLWPVVLMTVSYFLYQHRQQFFFLPILIIPFFSLKLTILPVVWAGLNFLFGIKFKRLMLFFLFFSLILLIFVGRGFVSQTVFIPDYEAQQAIVSKGYLYPSVFMARLFQNKAYIYLDKMGDNFFALVDPNNYFFGFRPREIVIDNQNLNKFPFLGLIFFLFGLYYLKQHPQRKFVVCSLIAGLISLLVLKIFDRTDFILWLPMGLVYIHGVFELEKRYKRQTRWFYLLFLIFTIPQLLRIFILFY